MASARKRAMTRNLTTTLAGIVALLLSIATTVLLILLAVYLEPQRQKVSSLAIAAIIVQCVAICTVALLLFSHVREGSPLGLANDRRSRNICFILSSFVIVVVAAVATGFTLGWTYDKVDYLKGLVIGNDPRDFLLVTVVIYGLSALSKLLLFTCLVCVRQPALSHAQRSDQTAPEMVLAGEDTSRPPTATTIHSIASRPASILRSPSAAGSDGHSSLRSSISVITRPTSSKTKLIRQHSFTRYSRGSSFENSTTARPSQDSGFDAWDTSTVAPHLRETVLHSSQSTKKAKGALEPIPGSRSPSPAKALEGPFFAAAPEPSPPPSPLPQPSYSRPPSRPRSPSTEEHIHPLFRTCSPSPPPTASSGTVVLAAPVAGQLVNERILRRMRSGSLPSSPSPLVRSESYFDFRTAPTSPNSEIYTPPIPEFIVIAGQRHPLPRAKSFKESPTSPIPGCILNAAGKEDLDRTATFVREGVGVR